MAYTHKQSAGPHTEPSESDQVSSNMATRSTHRRIPTEKQQQQSAGLDLAKKQAATDKRAATKMLRARQAAEEENGFASLDDSDDYNCGLNPKMNLIITMMAILKPRLPSTPTPLVTRQAARQRRATAPLPGALPTTPPPNSSPWSEFRTPREEQSPMSSEAETSAVLIRSSQSSSSESSNSPESSSSEDERFTSHQPHPEGRSTGAYRQSTISTNQKSMSATLAFNLEAEDKRPLVEVRITKLKECPMLTEGRMDNYLFQQWSIACRRYQKHSGKKPAEIIAYVADGMLKLRFVAWYHTNQSRIDAMTLDKYLEEFQRFALPRNWQTKVRDTILSLYQEGASFADWVVVVQNLNARLKNTSSEHTLTESALKAHLESHMRPDLHRKVDARKFCLPELADWIAKVTELDVELAEDRAQTQAMIDASNAERSGKRKPLAERLSEPTLRISSASPTTSGTSTPRLKLAKLTDDEKKLLAEHQGCTRCRTFYCDHARQPDACPMKMTNTWPDPKTTKTLTSAMALAAKPKKVAGLAYIEPDEDAETRDEDTDESYTYARSSSSDTEAPLSAPHMTTMLEVTGLAISSFPLSVRVILDNGCPSTVISDDLVS
ncbi:hypothetical protein C0992_011716 [Termitomyces sp. T32_za158]|nr:hypothetical protein C0992_011716 [Termitomyces sp. T32_za158]